MIATTRLETMLGDSAIAVNPNDSRYSYLIGKSVKHPYTGEHLPIISDDSINKDFGTGNSFISESWFFFKIANTSLCYCLTKELMFFRYHC